MVLDARNHGVKVGVFEEQIQVFWDQCSNDGSLLGCECRSNTIVDITQIRDGFHDCVDGLLADIGGAIDYARHRGAGNARSCADRLQCDASNQSF